MIFFLLLTRFVICATFYVSRNGTDSGPGSLSQPFKTIGRAQIMIRSYPGENNDVFIFPGIYDETLEFTFADSTKKGFVNTFQNYDKNNKPYIFGGKTIKGTSFEFDPSLKAYKVNIGAGTMTRQLFVNNRRSKRSRGGLPLNTKLTSTGYQLPSDYAKIWYSYTDQSNLEFVETKHWVQMRCLVANITASGAIEMQNPCWEYVRNPKRGGGSTQFDFPTYVENNLAFLSEPDEWYLDPTTGDLYYIPLSTEPIEKSTFLLPVQQRLVYGNGNSSYPISGISLKGLVFISSTWLGPNEGGLGFPEDQANVMTGGTSPIGSVEFQYAKNVNIEECVFTQLGGIGLLMGTGTQECTIQSNVVFDVSSVAIKIGDEVGNRASEADQTRNNVIFNNLVRTNGQDFNGAPAVMIGFCYNCTVSHNDISFTPYTGISHSWGWAGVIGNFEGANTITNNLVNNTMLELFDGGDFYTLGTQDVARSTCKENVFLGSHNCYGSLYLDDGSRYWDVYDNIVFGNVMTALIKGGEHNIHDNWWQNKGKVSQCGGNKDIAFMHNGAYCAPCNPKCTECGPISLKNNHEITDLSQAPKSILDNAGLVKGLKFQNMYLKA